jgi:hypothetical protein
LINGIKRRKALTSRASSTMMTIIIFNIFSEKLLNISPVATRSSILVAFHPK